MSDVIVVAGKSDSSGDGDQITAWTIEKSRTQLRNYRAMCRAPVFDIDVDVGCN